MTTPNTQPTPAQIEAEKFRAEIRASFTMLENRFDEMAIEIAELRADLAQMREGLTHASQPAPQIGQFTEMMIDNIIMTYTDKGEPAYKATGTPYIKYGVRVWPETLPLLGIDPTSLKPGPNPRPEPIHARVLMNQPEEGKTAQPRKVTGKA